MEAIPKKISVKDLSRDFNEKSEEEGVTGYGGKLDIRPPYQRLFIYEEKDSAAVIDTIMKDLPLNVMYWNARDDGNFEIIDGQQRTISICKYLNGGFSVKHFKTKAPKYFTNLTAEEKEQILNYELDVYVCKGSEDERKDWFETINIVGKTLSKQEINNAIYNGPWVTDAKRWLNLRGCQGYQIGKDYLKGDVARGDYLEIAINWISKNNLKDYMAKHQFNENADELWEHFDNVISWVRTNFKVVRPAMKSVAWGELYNKFKDEKLDPDEIEEKISKYYQIKQNGETIQSLPGIYSYVLTNDEKYLNLRLFPEKMKQIAYDHQKGICPGFNKQKCGKFEYDEMQADHIIPWSKNGETTQENCQMLCKDCNQTKSNN